MSSAAAKDTSKENDNEELFDAEGDNESAHKYDNLHGSQSPLPLLPPPPSFPSHSRSSSTRGIRESSRSTPSSSHEHHDHDHDHDENDPESPTFSLITSLRSQITDLTSQVHTLNSKLVSSFHKISDLEDEQEHARVLKKRVAGLEKEKQEWNAALEGGTFVERRHVQSELTSLMDKILKETEQRTSAEAAKATIEGELDQLSSSLFMEANKMVASERMVRAQAEAKMASLEESVQDMQGVLDALRGSLTEEVERAKVLEGENENMKRRFEELDIPIDFELAALPLVPTESLHRSRSSVSTIPLPPPNLMNSSIIAFSPSSSIHPFPGIQIDVVPYHEFLSFTTHLKRSRYVALHPPSHHGTGMQVGGMYYAAPPSPGPPPDPKEALAPLLPLSQHTGQPFVKRAIEEDSDPSLRLEFAPGLNWLSRRQIATAVLEGQLVIEPAHGTLPSASCSMCGTGLERWFAPGQEVETPAEVAQKQVKKMISSTWSFTRSKKDSTSSVSSASGAPSPKDMDGTFQFPSTSSLPLGSASSTNPNSQIYFFRVDSSTAKYTLCPTYCLRRLRAVCEFWGYVRSLQRGLLLEEYNFVGASPPPPPLLTNPSFTRPTHKSRPSIEGRRAALNSYRRTVSTGPAANVGARERDVRAALLAKTKSSSIDHLPLPSEKSDGEKGEEVTTPKPNGTAMVVDEEEEKKAESDAEKEKREEGVNGVEVAKNEPVAVDEKKTLPTSEEDNAKLQEGEKKGESAEPEVAEAKKENEIEKEADVKKDEVKEEKVAEVKVEEKNDEVKLGEERKDEVKVEEKKEEVATEKAEEKTEEAKEEEAPPRLSMDSSASEKETGSPSQLSSGTSTPSAPPPVPRRSAARRTVPPPPSSTPSKSDSDSPSQEATSAPPKQVTVATPPRPPPRRHIQNPSVASTIRPTIDRNSSSAASVLTTTTEKGAPSNGNGPSPGWEQRCYGEIVRLKESMFWARLAVAPPPAQNK
ncbi:hypothetical protein BT69DRAFT_1295794 [Atractiella rhizophila]|nr:hypothetical protein BT69DRAFT_1295794 [Atractiella rhizophila]